MRAQDVVKWALKADPVAKTSGSEWPGISKKDLVKKSLGLLSRNRHTY